MYAIIFFSQYHSILTFSFIYFEFVVAEVVFFLNDCHTLLFSCFGFVGARFTWLGLIPFDNLNVTQLSLSLLSLLLTVNMSTASKFVSEFSIGVGMSRFH